MMEPSEIKQDYRYILYPITKINPDEAEKRLTTLQKCIEYEIRQKNYILQVVKDMKSEVQKLQALQK